MVLRLREGDMFVFCGLIWVPYPYGWRRRSGLKPAVSLDREHGTLHVPDVERKMISDAGCGAGWRSRLIAPLYHHGELSEY